MVLHPVMLYFMGYFHRRPEGEHISGMGSLGLRPPSQHRPPGSGSVGAQPGSVVLAASTSL